MFPKHSLDCSDEADVGETPVHQINSETPTALHQDYFEQMLDLDQPTYQPTLDPTSEFPWHHPDKQILEHESNEPAIYTHEFFDPWNSYRGNILSHQENPKTEPEIEQFHEGCKHVWDNIHPQYNSTDTNTYAYDHNSQSYHTPHYEDNHNWNYDNDSFNFQHNYEPEHETREHQENTSAHEHIQHTPHNTSSYNEHQTKHHTNHDTFSKQEPPNENYHNENNYNHQTDQHLTQAEYPLKKPIHHVYCVHMDYVNPVLRKSAHIGLSNGGDELDEYYDDVRPRHPYDGFYLRHKATIDSRGKKICTHQVPLITRSPSPEIEEYEDVQEPLENGYYSEEENDTGVAGNLARVQPGIPLQHEAIDELTRRQGWESGNIDYMGADSFANIWAKISETLNQVSSSPPKQPSPPKETPQVSEEKAKDAVEELAEKVAVASISQPSDIPVPVIEAAKAAGKPSESPVTAIEVPEISPVPVSQLESKVLEAEEKICQAPNETVAAVEVSPSHDVPKDSTELTKVEPETSVTEADAAPSADLPDTPSEPTESTHVHEVPTPDNDAPKPDSISEKPVDVHAVEPISETPIEPQPELVVVPETASEVSIVAPQEEPIAPLSDVHESKPAEISSGAESEPAVPESKPEVSVPSDVHEPVPVSEVPIVDQPPVVPESKPLEPETNMPLEPSVEAIQVSQVVSPVETPQSETISAPPAPTQEQSPDKKEAPVSDSPPLANTPSQEEIPSATAAKSEERRKPAGKLELRVPAAADPLPTPDSEFEDAAALAQSIIASELRSPAPPTPPTPPAPSTPPAPQTPASPPAAVSLSQIGVKPKPKPSTAAQIESSVTEPKKKVVKKASKKDGVASGEAPVPPPRKKEKKPKDK